MLRVAVRHRAGQFQLDANFQAEQGVTALFGHSGAGKSTLLRIIAGFIRPDWSQIALGQRIFSDSVTRRFVPAWRRRIGLVFQDAQLFPHLSVRGNLDFAIKRATQRPAPQQQDQWIHLLELQGLLQRRVHRLSGGEKQRVAIARALFSGPDLILMDEPLAALDRALRMRVLDNLEQLRSTVAAPIVYVSHQHDEVVRLADQVVLMEDGRVRAQGTPEAVFGDPRANTDDPAAILRGVVAGHDASTGLTDVVVGGHTLVLPTCPDPIGAVVRIRIRASDVLLATSALSQVSANGVLPCQIRSIEAAPEPFVDVVLDVDGQTLLARVTARSRERLRLVPGDRVHALIKTASLTQARGSVGSVR